MSASPDPYQNKSFIKAEICISFFKWCVPNAYSRNSTNICWKNVTLEMCYYQHQVWRQYGSSSQYTSNLLPSLDLCLEKQKPQETEAISYDCSISLPSQMPTGSTQENLLSYCNYRRRFWVSNDAGSSDLSELVSIHFKRKEC